MFPISSTTPTTNTPVLLNTESSDNVSRINVKYDNNQFIINRDDGSVGIYQDNEDPNKSDITQLFKKPDSSLDLQSLSDKHVLSQLFRNPVLKFGPPFYKLDAGSNNFCGNYW